MAAIGKFFRWLGRKAILYAAIVAALLVSPFVVSWLHSEWYAPSRHLDRAELLQDVIRQLEQERVETQQRLTGAASAARATSLAQVNREIAAANAARAQAIKRRRSDGAKLQSLVTGDRQALIEDGRLELEVQFHEREAAVLIALRNQLEKQLELTRLEGGYRAAFGKRTQAARDYLRALDACNAATKQLTDFEKGRWSATRMSYEIIDWGRHRQLQDVQRQRCAEAGRRQKSYRTQRETTERAMRLHDQAGQAYRQSKDWTVRSIEGVTGRIYEQIAREQQAAAGSLRAKLALWSEQFNLPTVLKQAAIALLVVSAMPFLIRLFCYFILAPAAMRRPAIRLRTPGGAGAIIPPAERSTTSVGIRLSAGEELLVRQDYLQTTSHAGAKGTQWFLDWRHPVTSVATGLTFLTRIRGEGELTTVSAVKDPFAEIAVLELPEGANCVLQPRALAAVVQPIGRPLRIASEWRLLSINAWLTLQLRYLVFHGPARLVVKGGRGVRVERAERGRVFGQDQLVGFSADLAYSVTRTETFWPYFLGREQLLKDRVETGKGVLIVEEAPLAGRRGSEPRRGIEGMIDAAMKVFGL